MVYPTTALAGRKGNTMYTKLHIWCNGDHSVGIPGSSAELSIDLTMDAEYRTFILDTLKATFQDIWDDKRIYIMTQEEMDALGENA